MSDPKSPPDPFETFRRLWGPLGMPVPGMAMPTLDPDEVEKRIADLRSVETWLTMNLNMVRLSVQGLEVQKSALQALRGNVDAAKAGAAAAGPFAEMAAEAAAGNPENPVLWPWAMMQEAMTRAAPAPQEGERAAKDDKKRKKSDE